MTIFTQGPVVRPTRNLLEDRDAGQLDAARAAAEDAWIRSPTSSGIRNQQLVRQQEGRRVSQAYPAYGIPEVREEPETPLLQAEQARQIVQEAGLPLTIPDEGIRQGALDILMERKEEELKRQFILENAPASTVPLQILAGFAASAADPINVASAFIPVYGQARYATALANASGRAGRLGVRARVGAIQGAAGAAIVEPIVLSAAQREQADYGITESLANIAFGAALGGGLHTIGGAISDFRANRLAQSAAGETSVPDLETTPGPVEPVPRNRTVLNRAATADDPVLSMGELLRRQIEADRPALREQATRQAREELLPTLRQELESISAGRLPNVRELKDQQAQLQQQLDSIDSTFRQRAKRFQREEGLSRKQAESAARREIAAERVSIDQRNMQISEQLDVNRQAELARADINRVARGEVPERFTARVDERASQIAERFDFTGTARAVAQASPWPIRQAALRTAVAQMATGRAVNVDPVFAMRDGNTRPEAINQLKEGLQSPLPRMDEEAVTASRQAEELSTQPDGTELQSAQQLLDDELARTQEMTSQVGMDLEASMREANQQAADARTFAAAFRAAAVCRLRT